MTPFPSTSIVSKPNASASGNFAMGGSDGSPSKWIARGVHQVAASAESTTRRERTRNAVGSWYVSASQPPAAPAKRSSGYSPVAKPKVESVSIHFSTRMSHSASSGSLSTAPTPVCVNLTCSRLLSRFCRRLPFMAICFAGRHTPARALPRTHVLISGGKSIGSLCSVPIKSGSFNGTSISGRG